jgi:hypothetical protein
MVPFAERRCVFNRQRCLRVPTTVGQQRPRSERCREDPVRLDLRGSGVLELGGRGDGVTLRGDHYD